MLGSLSVFKSQLPPGTLSLPSKGCIVQSELDL